MSRLIILGFMFPSVMSCESIVSESPGAYPDLLPASWASRDPNHWWVSKVQPVGNPTGMIHLYPRRNRGKVRTMNS